MQVYSVTGMQVYIVAGMQVYTVAGTDCLFLSEPFRFDSNGKLYPL